MAWQNPKTDWKAGDVVSKDDFNRIEGNTQYLRDEVDSHKAEDASTTAKGHVRLSSSTSSTSTSLAATASAVKTVNDALTSHKAEDASTTAKGHVQLNNTVTSTSTTQAATANAVKTVNDGAKAYTDAHEQKAAPHSGHETPSGAQAKVDAHSSQSAPHSGHATTSALSTHTSATSAHSATSAATANRIMMRDASGRAKVAAPSAADDVARKDTVDAKFHATTGHKHTGVAGDGPLISHLGSPTGSGTWTTDSNGKVTIEHDLDRIPIVVWTRPNYMYRLSNVTTTSFSIQYYSSSSGSGNYWYW